MFQDDVILISDDDALVARALQRQLHRVAPELRVVHDGRSEVAEVAAMVQPLLVVLDMVQPVSGLTLLERLRKNPCTAQLPVLAISAVADRAMRLCCERHGVRALVEKPFDDDFVEGLAALARGEARARQGAHASLH